MIINFLWFGGLRNLYTNPALSIAFPDLANVPVLGGAPIFEVTLLILLVVGGIYWYGFKRRAVIASEGEGSLAG